MLLYNLQFKNIYITEVNLKILWRTCICRQSSPQKKKKKTHLKNTHFKIELMFTVFSLSGKKVDKTVPSSNTKPRGREFTKYLR